MNGLVPETRRSTNDSNNKNRAKSGPKFVTDPRLDEIAQGGTNRIASIWTCL